tara:strand:+ start:112 stop:453 length:342 start_codon:yes stop_codon:yes gene_type:complete
MSVKLLLLKSGDQIISDVKQIVQKQGHMMVDQNQNETSDKVHGYLLTKPHKITAIKPVVLTENFNDERNVEITLSPWILLTEDKEMTVPKEWIITIVNPIESIVKMYQEKIDG